MKNENIAIILPVDAPELTTFNLPTLKADTFFGKMDAINKISTPTIVRMEDDEMTFLLDNSTRFDPALYILDLIPDYDFAPKWVNFMTMLDVVSYESLSELLDVAEKIEKTQKPTSGTFGVNEPPVVKGQLNNGDDDDVNIITPERL